MLFLPTNIYPVWLKNRQKPSRILPYYPVWEKPGFFKGNRKKSDDKIKYA